MDVVSEHDKDGQPCTESSSPKSPDKPSEHDKDGQPHAESSSRKFSDKPVTVNPTSLTYVSVRSGSPEATVGQRPSIWSTYVQLADRHDENMFGRWNSSMNTLLIFVRVMIPTLVLL